ncbi:MAG: pre-peptidase C-terminal domain-containing protein [Phycisphaerae bacterium]
MKRLLALGLTLLVVAGASATIIESEPNNSSATANPVTRGPVIWADAGVFSLGAAGNDVDYVSINLNAGEIFTVITTPIANLPLFNDPDTMMQLLDSGGAEVAFNDDANGLGSAIRYQVAASGTYYVGVTGFGDRNFDGQLDSNPANGHGESGPYVLTMSIVPEPSSLALLLLGGISALGRRFAK